MAKPKSSAQAAAKQADKPIVAVIMGSQSDYAYMREACDVLDSLKVPFEKRIVSAHRTPHLMAEFAAHAADRGIEVIVAGAGGAAHLPGMVAAQTLLPVLGVPIPATALNGLDALMSIVQMPKGIPVGTLAIGKPGAANAAIMAAQIVGLTRPELRRRLSALRQKQSEDAIAKSLD